MGSLKVIFGNVSGPTRGVLPAAFLCKAVNIFSGVYGVESMRTPTAS